MEIFYPIPETMPDDRARFIQTVNTCQALARAGARISLITGLKKGFAGQALWQYYGLSGHDHLKLVGLPMLRSEPGQRLRLSWHGLFHWSLLVYLLSRKFRGSNRGVIYLRHLKLAEFLLAWRAWLKMPIFFEAHEMFSLTTENENSHSRLSQREARVLRDADGVICISDSLRQMVREIRGDRGGLEVVACGVKDDWLRPDHEPGGDYILYAGSLYPWKGVDTLIRAAVHLPGERLVIVGGGDRLTVLQALAASLGVAGRVDFVGPVAHQDLPQYLSRAKVAVLPNEATGTSLYSSPLKLFEYLAQGLPMAASDLPAFREILRDGENAVLFKPGDDVALAESLNRILRDRELALRLSKQARLDAEEYTYGQRGQKILDIVKGLPDSVRV